MPGAIWPFIGWEVTDFLKWLLPPVTAWLRSQMGWSSLLIPVLPYLLLGPPPGTWASSAVPSIFSHTLPRSVPSWRLRCWPDCFICGILETETIFLIPVMCGKSSPSCPVTCWTSSGRPAISQTPPHRKGPSLCCFSQRLMGLDP